MATEHFDVVIVGAGISGIGAGYHLKTRAPDRSYAIFEGRGAIGGTWDLFRYPGVRSDSDMFTLGYRFKPWTGAKSITDGASILEYLGEAARENGIDRHIRFRHRIVAADWSTLDATWTVTVEHEGRRSQVTCSFLYMCTGYYNYAKGYTPDFAGSDSFAGTIVHPQFWPEALDYAGKRVVVIGSGATAVTLIPELAKSAVHVTMLQRSPSYVVALPSEDAMARVLRRILPARAAYHAIRWRNVGIGLISFNFMRRKPAKAKQRLIGWVRDRLNPGYDVATHFTPSYNPWDQRLCVVPDGDLFDAINAGRAAVVTDRIARFVPEGIALESGDTLAADIVVTATGLDLQLMSDIPLTVDGARVDASQSINYKGMMFSDIPNLALSFGYTNASWTLKADLTAGYVARLLNTMRARGMRQVTPRVTGMIAAEPFLDFSSGYVERGISRFPRQGDKAPWRVHQNYARDMMALRFGSIDEDMEFSNPAPNNRARFAA
ncbi:flavin-containing monooxygenase [Sphingomonas japonica]|uniref:Cation diffusion facilitator CzcD-associated flavoprotein CzcO n=1 Tax=Sphingomonas japonica TaxID=511662 RepID=A0ABX0TVX9_9SPHN|nr:NAD(P)/FAD-dependent oxidoreductase [Sphingomonas japonica]NIJ22485.1 cation diffusion facilitator CzcD-associated flavoprotein CzcO [Sphingomonas japonica]